MKKVFLFLILSTAIVPILAMERRTHKTNTSAQSTTQSYLPFYEDDTEINPTSPQPSFSQKINDCYECGKEFSKTPCCKLMVLCSYGCLCQSPVGLLLLASILGFNKDNEHDKDKKE